MSGLRLLAGVALAASALATLPLLAQQPPPPAAAAPSPAQIKLELEKIKKGRTLALMPADGMEDTDGATVLRVDNTSPFNLVVLLVGPTTQRIEMGPERMQTLTIEPGDYEIAVTVVGRDLPPFYGTQRIVANMRFRHKFVIPVR
jgi:hypothetical protein